MSIIGRVLKQRALMRWQRLQESVRNPMPVQRRILRFLQNQGSRTVYGRSIGLDRCEPGDVAAFQRTVPLSRYEDVFEYWNRAFYGEPDVIWPGQIRYWGMSSGTTSAAGNNKYIPVTNRTIKTTRDGGLITLAPYLVHTHDSRLVEGDSKFLFLGGSTMLTEIPNRHNPRGLPNYHGDNTGIMAQFIPWWVQRYYAPGRDLAWLSDWELKVEAIAERTRHQDVRMVSGVPSWMAILFERIRSKAGGRPIGEVWPNLRLFIHGGMSFAPYRDLFHELIGRDIVYVDSYTATESGAVSVQDRVGGVDHKDVAQLIVPDLEAFYEFVPVDVADQKHPESHTLAEVRPGVEYAIVMTTNQGLCRYVIGDTVRFVDSKIPRFEITGRLSAFLNFFGEHVIVSELDSAIAFAAHRANARVHDYTVAPIMPTVEQPVPRHRWYVEFAGEVPVDLEGFAADIDLDIRENSNNRDYDSHRKGDQGLLPPEVVPVPRGSFYEWMKSRGKLGGQNKVPRVLTTSLEDSLRAMIGNYDVAASSS